MTSKLEEIIAHGNRGWCEPAGGLSTSSRVTCRDGYTLSVIAGGGTYCSPKPVLAFKVLAERPIPRPSGLFREVEHDYPGPYREVEVMVLGYGDGPGTADTPEGWEGLDDSFGVFGYVPVEKVRALVELHGGELSGDAG